MDVVAKITNDDGTEESFGPVEIPKKTAGEVARLLKPLEEKRQDRILAERAEQGAAEQDKRSKEAEKANQARIKAAGAEGIDD